MIPSQLVQKATSAQWRVGSPGDGHSRAGCGLPECLGLDVLDHDGVDELPPAMVGAKPTSHVPAVEWGPGGRGQINTHRWVHCGS